MAVFSGNANPALAQDIARHLMQPLGRAFVGHFSDGETQVELIENVRGRDVFLVQPTSPPANDHLMELLVMADACRRASAARITAVIPYFGYARQDRRPRATRVPITAKLVANMIKGAGVDSVLTVDLHADQIQGFFDIPVDNVYASPVLLGDAWKQKFDDMIVVSPDVGGVVRARALARRLDDADLAIIDKRRPRPNEAQVMNIIGDVDGKVCILVDDLVDTAGTLCLAAQALKDHGAGLRPESHLHRIGEHADAPDELGVRFVQQSITRENYKKELKPLLTAGPGPAFSRDSGNGRSGGLLGLRRLFLGLGAVHQLHERHGRVVALAEAPLEDAQVTAVAALVARPQLVEELHDHVAVAQAVEREALVGERRVLAERDDGLGHPAQLLGLRERGADRLVLQERDGHVAQHREAMAAGAVEFPQSVTVTHGTGPSSCGAASHRARFLVLADPGYGRSNPAGGQFSSFMPSDRPRDASTSLISFSDLRPRFGVFRSSVSVRWIRSPM